MTGPGTRPDEPVRMNCFDRQWREIGPEVLQAVDRVGAGGWYILGGAVRRFEQALARSWGAEFAVGVGNGTDALEIGLRALDVGPGDRVLTTPLSAFATTQAILRVGAVAVFVDVDSCGQIDLGACRQHLEAGPAARALVPVHLYGHALDLDELLRLRDDHGIEVVEDCAQAIGASWNGRPVGSVGRLAATSFYPTKNLGALGDGGAVLTDEPELAARAHALRNYGQTEPGRHALLGLNSRLDEVQAEVLVEALLPRLEQWTVARRRVAERYLEGLDNRRISVPEPPTGSGSVWHLFPVLAEGGRAQRDDLRRHLRSRGVESGIHFPVPIFEQAACRGLVVMSSPCERARAFADREVSLPINPFLTEAEIGRVLLACNDWRPS